MPPSLTDDVYVIVERSTNQELFERMTEGEQDTLLGAQVAAAVRIGRVRLDEISKVMKVGESDQFLVPKSPSDLGLDD